MSEYETLIKALVPVISMVLIAVLCGIALFLGYNGVLLSAVVALIAGIGGYTAKTAVNKIKE